MPFLDSRLRAFFSHPVVGVTGTVASLLGVVASLYFFLVARERPDLTCLVDDARSVVFRAGQSSQLRVTSRGKPVTSDVTAAQVIFWNAGRRSIRAETILQPFTVSLPKNFEILDARLAMVSRPLIDLTARQLNDHSVEVRWRLIERGDGGVLQLTYAGAGKAPISCAGVVEGQRRVRRISWDQTSVSSSAPLLLAMGLTCLFTALLGLRYRVGWFDLLFALGAAVLLSWAAYSYATRVASPSFDLQPFPSTQAVTF